MLSKTILMAGLLGTVLAQQIENRTIDQIYQAALAEGGVVTLWHGGDELNQQDSLKTAFEAQFPGITLNVTVDVSKYHDGKLDEQLAANNVYVDSIILQTLHDYPRWAAEDALLNYAPLGWDQIYSEFKEPTAAYYGLRIFYWEFTWSTSKLPNAKISEFSDLLKPEFKDKLVLTYPNDDDAVLFAFDLIANDLGPAWLDALIAQNPRWVRGTATPGNIVLNSSDSEAATFTSMMGLSGGDGYNISFPTQTPFVSWPQTGGILKNAPHPEAAKLLHAFILSTDYQASSGWSVRQDVPAPTGYPGIFDMPSTNITAFSAFMADRPNVERLRFHYESILGTAQGLSPLIDDL